MNPWYAAYRKDLPLAVAADARMPDLTGLLGRMRDDWGGEFEIWLTQESEPVAVWAETSGVHVRQIDREPVVAVAAPCLEQSLIVTAGVTHSVQLVFLGHGAISREGILLGGVYSLSYLVPRVCQSCLPEQWNLLYLELYRRFQGMQAVLPVRDVSGTRLVCGDPWALDECLLSGLPRRAARFHLSLRRLLLSPTERATGAVTAVRTDVSAFPSGAWQRLSYRIWAAPGSRFSAVAAKVQTIVTFRCRKYWRQMRGAA